MNFPSYLCNVNQKITIMAKAEYKNLTKDYRNMSLMSAVGIALSSWRVQLQSQLASGTRGYIV